MYKSILFTFLFSFVALFSFGQFQSNPSPQNVCEGNSASFNAFYEDADGGGVSFEWIVGGGFTLSGSGSFFGVNYVITTENIFGNFWETVLTLDNPTPFLDGSTVVAEETISTNTTTSTTISVNENPTVTSVADITTCEGEDAVFASSVSGGSGTYSYTWTRYTGASNASFDSGAGLSAGIFGGTLSSATTAVTNSNIGVQVTDGNGCSAGTMPASTTLTVDAAPTITAQPDATATFCSGTNVDLSVAANDASTYSWSDGSSEVGTAASYTANAAGTYTVTVGNAGCTAGSGAVVATSSVVSASPTLAITAQPVSPNIGEGESGSVSVTVTAGESRSISWFLSGESLTTGNTIEGTAMVIDAEMVNGGNSYTYTLNINNVAAGDVGKSVSATIADDCASVNSAPTVLPVEFTYVRAGVLNNSVKVEWETASELNNEAFFIERSLDGLTFTEIGNQQGAGTSLEVIQYSFIDVAPVAGVNYYRIRQVDFDGTMEYSAVVKAEVEKSSFVVSINPTASSSQVQIVLGETYEQDLNVVVYDALGRNVMNSAINAGNNILPIDVSSFISGQYFVRLFNETETITKTFFKL